MWFDQPEHLINFFFKLCGQLLNTYKQYKKPSAHTQKFNSFFQGNFDFTHFYKSYQLFSFPPTHPVRRQYILHMPAQVMGRLPWSPLSDRCPFQGKYSSSSPADLLADPGPTSVFVEGPTVVHKGNV